jgi:hypothetical protein
MTITDANKKQFVFALMGVIAIFAIIERFFPSFWQTQFMDWVFYGFAALFGVFSVGLLIAIAVAKIIYRKKKK